MSSTKGLSVITDSCIFQYSIRLKYFSKLRNRNLQSEPRSADHLSIFCSLRSWNKQISPRVTAKTFQEKWDTEHLSQNMRVCPTNHPGASCINSVICAFSSSESFLTPSRRGGMGWLSDMRARKTKYFSLSMCPGCVFLIVTQTSSAYSSSNGSTETETA